MRISEIMSPTVDAIDAGTSIREVARRMAEDDVGVLPVLSHGKLAGIITDRDIALRALSAGVEPRAPVRQIMTEVVCTCSPDDDVESVLALMSREQIRRVPVCDGPEIVGIVGLADAAKIDELKDGVSEALVDICEPTGIHCQAPVFA